MNDKGWQELINRYGVEGAFEYLLQLFHKKESLEQPSPNVRVPTITTNQTVEVLDGR